MVALYIIIIMYCIIFEFWSRNHHRQVIRERLEFEGAEAHNIERISHRESIYNVSYKKDNEWHSATVKFRFLSGDEWY